MLLNNTVSARQLQREYKKIFEQVQRTKEPVVVISDNKPQGAIVDIEMLEQMQREKAFASFRAIQEKNKDIDYDKAMEEITQLVEEVRQENYNKSQKAKNSS